MNKTRPLLLVLALAVSAWIGYWLARGVVAVEKRNDRAEWVRDSLTRDTEQAWVMVGFVRTADSQHIADAKAIGKRIGHGRAFEGLGK